MEIILDISDDDLLDLLLITKSRKASCGYPQDIKFHIHKAIDEFIYKYKVNESNIQYK